MKRGGPLRRLTALRNKRPLERKTSLEAGKGLKRAELVSKRPTVTPAERSSRRIVKGRALGSLCERCARCPSNAWWGCSQCHRECHASPALAYEQGWHVRSHQNPAVVPMWMAGRGLVLLRADGSVTPYREAA